MTEFDGTPKVETERTDGISHHPRWKDLQRKESNQEDLIGGSSLELHHKSRISPGLHP
jgi:hypothetical protein